MKNDLDAIKHLQRRGHLKQAKRLHRDVVRRRDNAIHQWSRELIHLYEHVFFGNAEILPKKNSKKTKKRLRQEQRLKDRQNEKIRTKSTTKENKNRKTNQSKTSSFHKPRVKHLRKRTGLNRSRLDAAWGKQNQSLQDKGRWTSRTVEKIDEKYTSVTCFHCKALTGPRGLSSVTVRQWVCSACTTEHDRDENAGENIAERGITLVRTQRRAEASASIEACFKKQAHREHEQPIQKIG